MTIQGFYDWTSDLEAGLIETTQAPENEIKKFNKLCRSANLNQPSFFISRCSWELLVNGISRDSSGKLRQWLPNGFEVYGFVFCLAINKNAFYFRIRTILKQLNQAPNGNTVEVLVETKNIAYVDVKVAIGNMGNKIKKDCLKFIFNQEEESKIIDSEVILKDKHILIPSSFGSNDVRKYNKKIENEGCIFGKNRIWDVILGKVYPDSLGTTIEISANEKQHNTEKTHWSRNIYFNFKINGNYKTNLPCPMPVVC